MSLPGSVRASTSENSTRPRTRSRVSNLLSFAFVNVTVCLSLRAPSPSMMYFPCQLFLSFGRLLTSFGLSPVGPTRPRGRRKPMPRLTCAPQTNHYIKTNIHMRVYAVLFQKWTHLVCLSIFTSGELNWGSPVVVR